MLPLELAIPEIFVACVCIAGIPLCLYAAALAKRDNEIAPAVIFVILSFVLCAMAIFVAIGCFGSTAHTITLKPCEIHFVNDQIIVENNDGEIYNVYTSMENTKTMAAIDNGESFNAVIVERPDGYKWASYDHMIYSVTRNAGARNKTC